MLLALRGLQLSTRPPEVLGTGIHLAASGGLPADVAAALSQVLPGFALGTAAMLAAAAPALAGLLLRRRHAGDAAVGGQTATSTQVEHVNCGYTGDFNGASLLAGGQRPGAAGAEHGLEATRACSRTARCRAGRSAPGICTSATSAPGRSGRPRRPTRRLVARPG